jgi:hypothetical protein
VGQCDRPRGSVGGGGTWQRRRSNALTVFSLSQQMEKALAERQSEQPAPAADAEADSGEKENDAQAAPREDL